jgi:threonine dehydrogenase-like Zn-dependent dehydrogenase
MVNMMKAVYCDRGPISLRIDYPQPTVDDGDALVRVILAGVCATDLEMMAGYGPDFSGVLGHEFVGIVEAAPGHEQWVGRRVVGEINIGCGECELCRRGLSKHCRNRTTVGISDKDGVFADHISLPVANLHHVPDDVSDEQAVFTEPLAAALQVLEQISVRPTTAAAVVGDGRLGLLIAQVLAQTGCRLTVFGRHEQNLKLLSHITAEVIQVGTSAGPAGQFADCFDIVVEATGDETGFDTARNIVRPGGVIVLKSTFAGPMAEFDSSSLVVDEVSIVGSRCGPFEPALRMLESGQVRVEEMIHARYSLDDAVQALDLASQKGVLKVLIQP